MFFFFFSFIVSMIFIVGVNFSSFFFTKSVEKSSPFECGFMVLECSRYSFSVQFFLFTLIFLLFDVEVSFLLPLFMLQSSGCMGVFSVYIFLFLIFIGTYYEWLKGTLDWLG